MDRTFHTLDVFTDQIFAGNPLAVYTDGRGLSTETMQRVAREMNLSETVFLLPPEKGGTKRVRIFTPGRELPFAGHPTIGTAWFLASAGEGALPRDGKGTLVLEENVGPVPVEITMKAGRPEFAQFTTAVPPEHRPGLSAAAAARLLALSESDIGAPGWEPEMVSCGLPFSFVPVRDLDAMGRARLNPVVADEVYADAWSKQTYLLTPRPGDSGVNVRVRMYGHGVGIYEDPATGSAAAALAAYLAKRAIRDGEVRGAGILKLRVEQGVEMGRPSLIVIEAEVRGGAVAAIRVGGRAVAVTSGTLALPDDA